MTVIIIDALNTYIKFYYPNKDKGYKDPALQGSIYFFKSIYKNISNIKRIYVVLDSVNKSKMELFPEYKKGRGSKEDILKNFQDFLILISKLPKVSVIKNEFREADEVIAYVALKEGVKNRTIIYSNDKDFIQLVPLSDNIDLSESIKSGDFNIVTKQDMLNKFKDSKKERLTDNLKDIIKWRTFIGDPSDKIPAAIPYLAKDKIKIIINAWEENNLNDKILGEVIMRLDDMNLKLKIAENFGNILRNFKLMDLAWCTRDIRLKEYTKRINIDITREKYISILDNYNLKNFKEFVVEKGYLN